MLDAPSNRGAASVVVAGVQMLGLRSPTLPPATHTNAFLVGTAEAVLIEPASPFADEIDRAVAWVQQSRRVGIEPKAILVSHHHADHMGGAVALKTRLGLPLWAHAETIALLRGRVRFERSLEHGERVSLDGPEPRTLRAVHTPGHAPGHLCFLEESSNTLLAGDMVASSGSILIDPDDGHMATYLKSLEALIALRPTLILPSHGDPIIDGVAKLRAYIAHRLLRERKVVDALRALSSGQPARLEALLPLAYADTPTDVWPLARRALLAHLVKLEEEKRAQRVGNRWRSLPPLEARAGGLDD